MTTRRPLAVLPRLFVFLGFLSAIPASAEWFATLKLPYNSPGYLSQWMSDPQEVLFTLNNHSAAPAPIVFELVVQTDALGEIFHGSCNPFIIVNNSPRAFRTSEVIRWNDVVWNPAVRGTLANAHRIPEGDVNVCVRVYEWKGTRGAQLAEACAKTNVVYPDVPQPTTPKDDGHVVGATVAFAWTAPEVPSDLTLQYRLDMAELGKDQQAADALAHPVLSKHVSGTTTTIEWGAPLKQGVMYCWHATALDQYGLPATAHDGNSRNVKFHFDPPDDREASHLFARWKKEAQSAVATAKSDAAAATLIAPVEGALNAEPSAKMFADASVKLNVAIDSLTATVSAATMDALCHALTMTQLGKFLASSGGAGPFDSLISACASRVLAVKHLTSPSLAGKVDSLLQTILNSRKALIRQDILAAALAMHQQSLTLDAAGTSETPIWHERMQSLLNATAAFLSVMWPAGGSLVEAELLAERLQSVAPKKGADQVAMLKQQIDEAKAQATIFATSSTPSPNDAKMYGALQKAMTTGESVRSQWKGSPDGPRFLEGIRSAVNVCADVLVRDRGSRVAELFFHLVRAQLAAAKKGAAEFDPSIASCSAAFAQPKNGAMQAQTVTDVRRAVREHLGKGDKAWSLIPKDWLDSTWTVFAFAGSIADLHDAIMTVASGAKDQGLKTSATKLAAYCDDIVNRCGQADANSSLFRELGTTQLQRRMAIDLIRDVRQLGRMAGGTAADACKLMENNFVHGLLERVYVQGSEMADVQGALQKRGLTCTFGQTANNSFVEIQGNVLMINDMLADQAIATVVPYIVTALQQPPAVTAQAKFETMIAARDALKKAKGEGWNGRSDCFLDAGVLGEQEMTRILRVTGSK